MNNSSLNTAFMENEIFDGSDASFENYFLEASFTSSDLSVTRNLQGNHPLISRQDYEVIKAEKSPIQVLRYKENTAEESIRKEMRGSNELFKATEEIPNRKMKLNCKKICSNIIRPLAKKLKGKTAKDGVADEVAVNAVKETAILNRNVKICNIKRPRTAQISSIDNFAIYGDLFYCYV